MCGTYVYINSFPFAVEKLTYALFWIWPSYRVS